jgi:hypothetical protein
MTLPAPLREIAQMGAAYHRSPMAGIVEGRARIDWWVKRRNIAWNTHQYFQVSNNS